ncbi:MAG: redoxin domain-containing protein [Bacteroidetes bacterium]|nr:redoxin domain-containing protein [Bacteroidota bacterium]MBU1373228.1 redoxin domain-containing protein [Bacteroidota bacterium]MBU1486300.1 redoxin domain-containing protein [Bacteroidota bacterium]MBU1761289.1 redoxin domain-containing protein [Bacteroidota bacterium]MBU2267221.1 redoxin domain-containing protein [Bacteroidota bacterium]
MTENTIYQFKVENSKGEEINLQQYEGKVLMIVNTASECGFTPQLQDLEELRKEFENQKFEILAFPSNDFGQQEPLNDEAIGKFCAMNYHTRFTIFKKTRVRGSYASPLFKFLADKKQNGHVGAAPRWNFHKYLVNSKGEVIDYFFPFTKPNSAKVKKKIQKLLSTTKKD